VEWATKSRLNHEVGTGDLSGSVLRWHHPPKRLMMHLENNSTLARGFAARRAPLP